MAFYSTSEFKNGLKLMIDGSPFTILDNDVVKPGKGQAFNRVKLRNLKTGRVIEKTYKSSESVEGADVVDLSLQYLYNDGEMWYFMDPSNFEQLAATREAMGEVTKWLKGEEMCDVTLWNGNPLSVAAPNFVILKITETDPGIRGDTATGGTKPAKLETGAVVKVPLFVEEGETIKVDTRTETYISRVKE